MSKPCRAAAISCGIEPALASTKQRSAPLERRSQSCIQSHAAPALWYFTHMASLASILPFLNVYFASLGRTDTEIGLISAVRQWVMVPASFLLSAIADHWNIHQPFLFIMLVLSTASRVSLFWCTSFGLQLGISALTQALSAPVTVLADTIILSSLQAALCHVVRNKQLLVCTPLWYRVLQDGQYGRVAAWAALGFGGFSAAAGPMIQQLGYLAGFIANAAFTLPCLLATALLKYTGKHDAALAMLEDAKHRAEEADAAYKWYLMHLPAPNAAVRKALFPPTSHHTLKPPHSPPRNPFSRPQSGWNLGGNMLLLHPVLQPAMIVHRPSTAPYGTPDSMLTVSPPPLSPSLSQRPQTAGQHDFRATAPAQVIAREDVQSQGSDRGGQRTVEYTDRSVNGHEFGQFLGQLPLLMGRPATSDGQSRPWSRRGWADVPLQPPAEEAEGDRQQGIPTYQHKAKTSTSSKGSEQNCTFDGIEVPEPLQAKQQAEEQLLVVQALYDKIQAAAALTWWQRLGRLLSTLHVWLLLWNGLLQGFGHGVSNGFLFIALKNLGAPTTLMGLTVTVECLASFPAFYFKDQILRFISLDGLLHISTGLSALRLGLYALLPVLPSPWVVLPIQLIDGLTYAWGWGGGTIKAQRLSPPGLEATMQGLFQAMFMGVGSGFGGLYGGFVLHRLGMQWMWLLGCAVTVVGWAIMIGIQLAQVLYRRVCCHAHAGDDQASIAKGQVQLSGAAV